MILRKGETYLGSLLILLILLLIFAALVTQNVRVRPSPIVDEAFWLAEDQKVTAANVNSKSELGVAFVS